MKKHVVAITGASGYIGRHLVAELIRLGSYEIRVLSRGNGPRKNDVGGLGRLTVIEGDLNDPNALQQLILPGSTAVNLAYLWEAGEAANMQITAQLIRACERAGEVRLVHCSTAAVSGRVCQELITERTQCRPVTEYGITKLKIEQSIAEGAQGRFDAAILRPTSVFGIDGEPLRKLAGDLLHGNYWKNYAKSCLFGERRMNLVHVANVVAALLFLIDRTEPFGGETFIVSDDDYPNNNFSSVERVLIQIFGLRPYPLPKLRVPLSILSGLLKILGRNNVNPRATYDPSRLLSLGFQRPVDFDRGLIEYANWCFSAYRTSCGKNLL